MKIKINKCTGDLWYKNHKFPMYTDVIEATAKSSMVKECGEFIGPLSMYYYSDDHKGFILKSDAICDENWISVYGVKSKFLDGDMSNISADKVIEIFDKDIFEQQKEYENSKHRTYEGGAKRDSNEGKVRPDLISPLFLKVLGEVLRKGADKYGERNWEKGISQESFKESAARHYVSWMNNETDEDHAGNLCFNLMGWIHFREKENESKLL